MKKTSLLLIFITVVGIIITISCERDDICPESTATTPSLIIDAYDVDSTDDLLAVNDLLVYGTDNDEILSGYAIATVSQIVLPLKTDVNTTRYALVKDAFVNDNDTPDDTNDDYLDGNTDYVTINYTREEVYVSRACGYKTIYKNVTFTIEPDSDNWIKSRQPLNDNQSVEDETETHFNIFH
ncbi:hypothetical protein EV196_108201 [Mariniflexile fucanivorans]|uniref:Uncharacterized protein n=1 Tax=Mariniflexile fucanivorans TaxID=264023 RepID=A0A4R1RDP7_9FLAO|nr:DUF6452 family protein [Mariniflexile fucanivorans]TCL64004.1 hypothetical protein EV196_108201 [Mariniflexile fucanivorans]